MANWRRKAELLFPKLKRELNAKDYTIYSLFTDLQPMCRDAHASGDEELMRRIYGFSEWSLMQKAKDLWNAAGVSFYEHLVDQRDLWPLVIPWLSPFVITTVRGLWEWRLTPAEFSEFEKLIRARKKTRYQELQIARKSG